MTDDAGPARQNRLYVNNLAWRTSWQDLKDFIRDQGFEPTRVDVFHDASGRSRGCGIIAFDTPEEAQDAIAKLNEKDLHGRNIFIREDREPEYRPRTEDSPAGGRGGGRGFGRGFGRGYGDREEGGFSGGYGRGYGRGGFNRDEDDYGNRGGRGFGRSGGRFEGDYGGRFGGRGDRGFGGRGDYGRGGGDFAGRGGRGSFGGRGDFGGRSSGFAGGRGGGRFDSDRGASRGRGRF